MIIKRWKWIVIQIALIFLFLFATTTVIEMTYATPNQGYTKESGQYVSCEALEYLSTRQVRSGMKPSCASFGSMETNKLGYLYAWLSVIVLIMLLWFTSRPGRGLHFSRH